MPSAIIERFDSWLKTNRPDFYESLRDGVSPETLDELENEFGFALPAIFRELYLWSDGQEGDCPPPLIDNKHLIPVDYLMHSWRELTGMQEHGQWEQPQWWSRGWVPFTHNGAGSHLCVDMLGSFSGKKGQVIEFWAKFDDRPIVAPDLETWLTQFVDSLEAGHWAIDDDGNFSLVKRKKWLKVRGYPIVCDSNDPLPS